MVRSRKPDQRIVVEVACGRAHVLVADRSSAAPPVLHAAQEADLGTPGQVAIAGFDDLDDARDACPSLTSITRRQAPPCHTYRFSIDFHRHSMEG
ncbi:substrate-binding domain-containing protein [Streptomyces griseorubiginosus]|uniref:substrate-binding domain-containing protein n=1 Tax=Streptomyces griseorubiginosus TaxID=67304 RepID=UPI0036EF8632